MNVMLLRDKDDDGSFVDVKYIFDNHRTSIIWIDHKGAQFVTQFTGDMLISGIEVNRNKRLIIEGVDLL